MQQFATNRRIGQPGHDTDLILKLGQTITVFLNTKEILDIIARYSDALGFLLDDLGQRFTGHFRDFTLKVPHACLAGVIPDHAGQGTVINGKFLCLEAVVLDLLGHKMLFGNLALFFLGIAGQRDNLHPVKQRARHVIAVGRGQEHHVREVIFDLKVVVHKCGVLFRIKHLEHCRRGIAAEILTHLVDFIEQDQRVVGFRLFQRLNDLTGHGADIGPAVTADLGFVTHTTKADANEFAPRGFGNGFTKRRFTHTRRADKAHDRAFQLGRPLLHGKIFHDAFFNLFKAIVIIVEHLLCFDQVLFGARFDVPRDRQDPVEVVAHNCGFRRHRRHVFELFQLGVDLLFGFLAQLGVRNARFQLGQFAFAVLAIAQLGLNGLHLLIQIILSLCLLHLRFHAGLDLFLDLQDRHFALHQAVDFLKTLGHGKRFKQILLLLDFNAQVTGNQIGKPRRFSRFRHGGQRFFGDVFLDLGVAFEFFGDGLDQRPCGGFITGDFAQILGRCLKEAIVIKVFCDADAGLPFDQHLDGAIGQFQQLQHIGQHTCLKNTVCIRVVDAGINLTGQQNLLVVSHDFFQRAHRFFAAHEKRDNHMREHHDVAQGQHGIRCVQRL